MKKLLLLIAIFIANVAFAQNKEPWQKKYKYSLWDTNEILAATNKNGRAGYITQNGKVVIPFIYEKALPFNTEIGNLGFVKKNNRWGAVDLKGRQKIEHLYEDIDFLRNVIRVKLNGKWGAIDTNGIQIVSFVYESSGCSENEGKKQN